MTSKSFRQNPLSRGLLEQRIVIAFLNIINMMGMISMMGMMNMLTQ